ncbi:MAG TPA: uracil-DNA glycosylase [Candidatus Limiplasma sp.]|nr:uracil-DNA glycosylase [Candidatus Limiplasma sp.]
MKTSWTQFSDALSECAACRLCENCRQKVPGQGDPNAPLMLIGEGPGEQEDKQGLAFVGPAGQLLTKMLEAIQLPRNRVYICNIVKCRPPNNRTPLPDEMAACEPHLLAQWALVQPKVVLLLGATAVKGVLGENYRITRCRGQWFERRGTPILATYHPSALLRDQNKKYEAWADLKLVRQKLMELELYSDLIKGEP